MKNLKSSSLPAVRTLSISRIEFVETPPEVHERENAFAQAINGLSMARRLLLEGDEAAATRRAQAALGALQVLAGMTSQLAH